MTIQELAEQKKKLLSDNQSILDRATKEGRAINTEERSEYDKRDADIDRIDDELKALTDDEVRRQRHNSRLAENDRPLPRTSAPSIPGGNDPKNGKSLKISWGSAGEIDVADIEEDDPALAKSLRERSDPDYAKRFRRFLRGENGRSLGLVVGDDTRGGYTAPTVFLSNFIKFLDDASRIRGLATVLTPTNLKSVGMLSYDTDYADADWSAEVPASDISEDAAARFGQRELMPHLFSKAVRSSRKMLRNSSLSIETFIAQRLAYKFAITENKAYMTGDGAQQPLGMFIASNDGIPTTRDTTASSATTFTADDLIDLQHSVKDVYRAAGSWIVSRTFRKMCRKLKDGNGNYLMVMNTASGMDTLLERPLVVDENAPSTFTTGQYVAIFGDIKFYYIQDGIDLEIQRLDEIQARKNQVEWIARKETDGMPVLGEAFARLKLG